MFKSWELSVDLKLKRNDSQEWANVFMFIVTVENRAQVISLRTEISERFEISQPVWLFSLCIVVKVWNLN